MLADIRQPQRSRIVDQHAEDASSTRQIPDLALGFRVDAAGHEALEGHPIGGQDADRCVAGAREFARGIENRAQDRLGIEFGDKSTANVEQPPQARLIQRRMRH